MGLFSGPDTARLEARVARVERMLTMVMEHLGLELPAHPAADAIREAVDAGRKIEAIKLYREATGAGLAEAKDAIDRGTWEAALHGIDGG
jgi:hypothetical protein